MKRNFQETVKHKTNRELERIAKGSTSHSAEERLFVIEELEKKGIEWEETPLRPSLATLKRNLQENIKQTKKDERKIAIKKQEEWTGEPMTFWEGVRGMTPIRVLKVLYYQCIVWQERVWGNIVPFQSAIFHRAFSVLLFGFLIPPLVFVLIAGRYLFDFEFPAVYWYIVTLVVIGLPLYLLLVFDGQAEKIYEEKPAIFNNHKYSRYFFNVVFWVPFVAMILAMILIMFIGG